MTTAMGVSNRLRKKPSRSYRLRFRSNVIENLTPKQSLELVLLVIWSDPDDDPPRSLIHLANPDPTPSTSSAPETTTKGKANG